MEISLEYKYWIISYATKGYQLSLIGGRGLIIFYLLVTYRQCCISEARS